MWLPSKLEVQSLIVTGTAIYAAYILLRMTWKEFSTAEQEKRGAFLHEALKQKVDAIATLNELHCKTLETKIETLSQKCEMLDFHLRALHSLTKDSANAHVQKQLLDNQREAQEFALFKDKLNVQNHDIRLEAIEHHLQGQLQELALLREKLVIPPSFKGLPIPDASDSEIETAHYPSPATPYRREAHYQAAHPTESQCLHEELLESLTCEDVPQKQVKMTQADQTKERIFDALASSMLASGVQDQHQKYDTSTHGKHHEVTVTRSHQAKDPTE